MVRSIALLFAIATIGSAQNGSKDTDVSFEIEPPLLIPNRGNEPLPEPSVLSPDGRVVDVAKIEKDFERAKRSAVGVERFCKIGALSKVEAEQRLLRFVRLESDLANALLAQTKADLLEKQKQSAAGQISKEDLTKAENALALAIESAHVAAVKRERAELEAAEANLHRQEKLLAFGRARKSDVATAEQKLAELKAAKN
jgi:hypothetical protein